MTQQHQRVQGFVYKCSIAHSCMAVCGIV